jgi:predicted RNA-binding protein with PUA-like domain
MDSYRETRGEGLTLGQYPTINLRCLPFALENFRLKRMKYWLMKSEPDVFSIDDLKRVGIEPWNGVRNYQARNFMREMKKGDQILFYHSNADEIGVVGLMSVSAEAYPDPTQFEAKSEYFDPKSTRETPRWSLVDVSFVEKFPKVITLVRLKNTPELEGLLLLRKGSRLSVIPVEATHFKKILKLAKG